MDDACRELCAAIGDAIVRRDYTAVHSLLAPWMRARVTPADLERQVADQCEGLAHPPSTWSADEGLAGLDDLRKPDGFGPPSEPMPSQVTPANFRGWLSIQLAPEPEVHDEQNVCCDVWLAAVEHEGKLVAGYLEAAEAA